MNYVIPNVSAQRQADASDDVKYLAIVGRFASFADTNNKNIEMIWYWNQKNVVEPVIFHHVHVPISPALPFIPLSRGY